MEHKVDSGRILGRGLASESFPSQGMLFGSGRGLGVSALVRDDVKILIATIF